MERSGYLPLMRLGLLMLFVYRKATTKTSGRSKLDAALTEAKAEVEKVCGFQEQAVADAVQQQQQQQQQQQPSLKKAGPGGTPKSRPPRNHEWVGRSCKLFSKKVNYPAGGWLSGVVKQFCKPSVSHLVVYDDKSRMPEWVDFSKTAVEEISELEKKVKRRWY